MKEMIEEAVTLVVTFLAFAFISTATCVKAQIGGVCGRAGQESTAKK